MKKQYTMPSMKVHTVKPATMICGSGGNIATMGSGSGNTPSSTTTQNGVTGIFSESKGGFWFNDEE